MSKRTKVIIIIFISVCIVALLYSIINIFIWKKDSNKTNEQIENIQEITQVEETKDTLNTEVIEQEEEIPKSNSYWDYIGMSMINVDFNELKSINKNVVGWVFLDSRNNKTNNKNTIIYAHGRTDKTMFWTLKNVLSSTWQNNSNNYVIKISTETENSLWQIFSTYHIPTTSDYLITDFNNDDEFIEFTNKLINRSSFNFNTSVSVNDNILTLSTCYNNSDKIVVHAKLIKKRFMNNKTFIHLFLLFFLIFALNNSFNNKMYTKLIFLTQYSSCI